MSYGLFLPRRWTRQPQGPVEVDWGNPISLGLCALAVPRLGGMLDVFADRLVRSTDHPYLNTGPKKNAIGTNRVAGTSYGAFQMTPANPSQGSSGWTKPTAAVTVSAVIERYGDAVGNAPIVGVMSPYISPYTTYSLVDATGLGNATFDASPGGSYTAATAVGGLLVSGRFALTGTYDGAVMRMFRSGRQQASTAASGVLSHFSAADKGAAIGNFFDFTSQDRRFNGSVFLAAVWDRARSAEEERVFNENPWQLLKPRRPVLYSLGGGATHELAGDATAGASAAGDLTTGIQLDGDASAAATASGDLTTGIPLAGDAAASAQASGTLSTEIRLAAAALVSATATGSLSTAINLAGSAAFASLADGTLTTQIRLAGAAIAGAVADAGLSTQILLDADAQAGSDASGELTTVPSGLAGDAVAGATASGALSVQIILAGDAIASVLASGDLTTAGAGAELAGDATVLAIASGGLTTAIQLTGAPVISVTASGELSIGLGMTAEALATVSASAVLSTQIRMEGAAVASALAAGNLEIGSPVTYPLFGRFQTYPLAGQAQTYPLQ